MQECLNWFNLLLQSWHQQQQHPRPLLWGHFLWVLLGLLISSPICPSFHLMNRQCLTDFMSGWSWFSSVFNSWASEVLLEVKGRQEVSKWGETVGFEHCCFSRTMSEFKAIPWAAGEYSILSQVLRFLKVFLLHTGKQTKPFPCFRKAECCQNIFVG